MEKPKENAYTSYHANFIKRVADIDIYKEFKEQIDELNEACANLSSKDEQFAYAAKKWSIRELIGHLIDTEVIFGYRLLSISRDQITELPGFNQEEYVANANYSSTPLQDLLPLFESARKTNMYHIKLIPHDKAHMTGITSGYKISVSALAYLIAGHARHHIDFLKKNYLTQLN